MTSLFRRVFTDSESHGFFFSRIGGDIYVLNAGIRETSLDLEGDLARWTVTAEDDRVTQLELTLPRDRLDLILRVMMKDQGNLQVGRHAGDLSLGTVRFTVPIRADHVTVGKSILELPTHVLTFVGGRSSLEIQVDQPLQKLSWNSVISISILSDNTLPNTYEALNQQGVTL